MGKGTSGFTLAELLVVIAILAIISVTAYTNFAGSTDKANNSTKLNQMASIDTALNVFYNDNNYYPMPSAYSGANNVWGYNAALAASINNTLDITLDGNKISSVVSGSGGGMVYLSGGVTQIGAKGVIDSTVISKKYLSNSLSDPSLKDKTVGNDKTFSDYGIGKYVYGVYAKSDFSPTSTKGKAYNLAVTLSDETKGHVAVISGNFDASTCVKCPNSLIGSGSANVNLQDKESSTNGSYKDPSERIPYPIDGF